MPQAAQSSPPITFLDQLRGGLSPVQFKKAISDISEGWQRRELWGTMALHDIRQRYRRSVLGPFWITISMGVMIGALGLLYSTIFKQETSQYMPFLAAGFVVWGAISGMILEGSQVFAGAEGLIRQLPAPLSIHVYRVISSNLIIFAHNIWIFFIVALWYGATPQWTMLLAVPGLFFLILNGFWMALLLGLLSARFRDIPLVVASVVQVLFFITPVMWMPAMLPGRALILHANPFYHLIEVVRQPMLGHMPSAEHWIAVVLVTLVGWALALAFYGAYRWRLAYWV